MDISGTRSAWPHLGERLHVHYCPLLFTTGYRRAEAGIKGRPSPAFFLAVPPPPRSHLISHSTHNLHSSTLALLRTLCLSVRSVVTVVSHCTRAFISISAMCGFPTLYHSHSPLSTSYISSVPLTSPSPCTYSLAAFSYIYTHLLISSNTHLAHLGPGFL
jgi:hypothetical protein